MHPRRAPPPPPLQTTRRDWLRLLAAGLSMLPRAGRAQGPAPVPKPPPRRLLPLPRGPWPTAEKLQQTNRENVAALAKVKLDNGDAPDLFPRPPLPRHPRGRR